MKKGEGKYGPNIYSLGIRLYRRKLYRTRKSIVKSLRGEKNITII